MLFPELVGQRFGYVNLNDAARRWFLENNFSDTEMNPLLDPSTCEAMVTEVHASLGLDYSYGGWLEDRRILWRGSYLDGQQTYVHLGLDLNVPVGTSVALDDDAEILQIDSDVPEEGGWGTRVIVQPARGADVLVYAHLDAQPCCEVGEQLPRGTVIARVGSAPLNGGWFSHLHVQCVDRGYYQRVLRGEELPFDGYGASTEIQEHARLFKDPFTYLSLT